MEQVANVGWNRDKGGMEQGQGWDGTRTRVGWNRDKCGMEQGQELRMSAW